MRKLFYRCGWYCVLLFLHIHTLGAQILSEQAHISLLTFAPGTELYAAFGHSALRVQDPATALDRVYNYGMFSFEEPGFYLKFMQGRLDYWLGAYDFSSLEQEQQRRGTRIQEQILNLNQQEKQALVDFLNDKLQPANRFYLYDFFFDNCATRIHDALQNVLGDRLQPDTSFVAEPRTFRSLFDDYLTQHPWAAFGIHLVTGSGTDRVVQPREYLFLPDYLAASWQKSTLQQYGQQVPLVQESHLLFQGNTAANSPPAYLQPSWIFSALVFILLIWTFLTRQHGLICWPDMVWLSLYGLMGVLLCLLWFATDHQATKANYNLLWLHPLHLLTACLLAQKHKGLFTKIYLLLNGFAALLLLACWQILPQTLHPACLPLIILSGFRYFYQASTITFDTASQTSHEKLTA